MCIRDSSIDERISATAVTADYRTFPLTAPLWNEGDFVPGRMKRNIHFRRETILRNHPKRDRFLNWFQSEQLQEFVDHSETGPFQGHRYHGSELKSIDPYHIPPKFKDKTTDELHQLEQIRCIVKWS